jgi:hypothetical protein
MDIDEYIQYPKNQFIYDYLFIIKKRIKKLKALK